MELNYEVLEEFVVARLIELGYHIAFAESCTGGLACGRLVDVEGASKVLNASMITYADAAKVNYLGVSEATITAYGVVSEEVAGEMAAGICRATDAEVGVAITGVAGPGGGTKRKPVGMVCFGFFMNGTLTTNTMQFGNLGRNTVRKQSVQFVFEQLTRMLAKGVDR